MVALPAKAGDFTRGVMHVGNPTRILPVGTSTSRRSHLTARNGARKLRVTSPAGCMLTYLQFAGEFTRDAIADCLQLRVFLPAFAGIFTYNFGFFASKFLVFLPAKAGNFACQSRANLHEFRM